MDFTMRWLVYLTISLICSICSNGNSDKLYRILIFGETGKGKSTTIKNVFGVENYIPIGHGYGSETKDVKPYYVSMNDISYLIYDTPGMYDTDGLTTEQILELIEIELQSINNNHNINNNDNNKNNDENIRNIDESHIHTPQIDAMILMTSTSGEKVQIKNHLREYISLLGETMLKSLIVIVNSHEKDGIGEARSRQGYIRVN